MFEIKNKSINGQYQFLCDRKLRITRHRQNRKSWSRVRIPRHGPIFHLHIIKIWQMKKNTYMHFKEESIIYIWSKFQLDTCMFDSNILLTKFGSGFWFRLPRYRTVVPGFIHSRTKWPVTEVTAYAKILKQTDHKPRKHGSFLTGSVKRRCSRKSCFIKDFGRWCGWNWLWIIEKFSSHRICQHWNGIFRKWTFQLCFFVPVLVFVLFIFLWAVMSKDFEIFN